MRKRRVIADHESTIRFSLGEEEIAMSTQARWAKTLDALSKGGCAIGTLCVAFALLLLLLIAAHALITPEPPRLN